MSIHVFTSITCNYIPKARVLADSIKKIHPDFVFHLVLVDTIPSWFRIDGEPFDSVINVYDLRIKNAEQWLFKHSVVEACTGVKGFALMALLSKPNCSAVLYFDPDIVILSSLEGLLAEFERASILLTPHLVEPEQTSDAIYDNEFSVLQHGIYNLGFLGVKNSIAGNRFAQWWADRLDQFCYDDIPRGIFTDQRWADLAPAYFDEVRVLRGPEYNVCTWNLTHRCVKGTFRSGFTVNGRPLAFYHFSGIDSGAQEAMLQKYGAKMPALNELREWYLNECDRREQAALGALAWRYGSFDNGRPVTSDHRKRYRERTDLQEAFPEPYATANISRSYYHWFEKNDETRFRPVSKLIPLLPSATTALSAPQTTGQPTYRIFLSICESSPEATVRAARDVKAKSFRSDALYAIGSETDLAVISSCPDLRQSFHLVALADPATHDRAFVTVASEFGRAMDFVFVTPAVTLSQLWDLRLAWTACRIQGAGTVSPISDTESLTRLGLATTLWEDVDQLDGACYESSYFANLEIPHFARHCVYVRRNAVMEAGDILSLDDFAAKASQLRWSHVLAEHVYTGLADGATALAGATPPPASISVLHDHLASGSARRSSPADSSARRQLHILHSWGGGLERWVREYCRADHDHRNFVLKSIGTWGAFGMELRLYHSVDDEEPIRQWSLTPSIKHTAGAHAAYRAALADIVYRYGIDAILVSSLIGHSLEALRTGLPTVMVCHDYYPFCPALNVTFGETVCQHCGDADLQRCTRENVHHRFFLNVPPSEWAELRGEFSRTMAANTVTMVAPSASVQHLYAQFMPELGSRFRVIPHGTPRFEMAPLQLSFNTSRRLRVAMLGAMAPHKGLALLKTIAPGLLSFADLYLLGCGDSGLSLKERGVTVIPSYEWGELPVLLQSIAPDVGLLLSVVPETFSYTLQELFDLGVPPVATRLGSFADRIQDGVNGFLVDPTADAVLRRLRDLAQNRTRLDEVHQFLRAHPPRRTEEMLADYEALLGLPSLSEKAYFARNRTIDGVPAADTYIQLMWETPSSAFREESSAVVRIRAEKTATVLLRIPEQSSSPTGLRVDLGETRGFLRLLRLRLLDVGGKTIWSWQSREDPFLERCHDLLWVGDNGNPGALVYLLGSDPHFILPVPLDELCALERGGALEIEVEYPSSTEVMGRMSSAVLAKFESEVPVEQRELLRAHIAENPALERRETSTDRLLQQLAAARSRVDDLEGSLSWRTTAPLRWVGELILRTRRASKNI